MTALPSHIGRQLRRCPYAEPSFSEYPFGDLELTRKFGRVADIWFFEREKNPLFLVEKDG